ncbi:GntR family transcriptional regulator [Mediterraneibacter massiliensis]|jgi:GntR family transcriptional regulator|uniref:GntR family transcriptional regulator n=1 Tax=Mediterraneibacter massiliensis TaxID=1720300 RepID=UPI000E532BE8|nr:GntR family transcriptional regulator [Mediterraneibacter massiliensis]RGT71010.1 GntR family transcriptional regulator [Ruminococcus sp. AF18-22]
MIEKMNSTPLYLQLKNKIKREIRTGILKPGDKIPSEAQLQKEYGMSRVTVRNAMEELTVEGYIIKVQGKGSFVAQSDMLRLPIGVTSFTEDAKMQGVSLTSKVIKAGIEEIHSELDRNFFGGKTGGKIFGFTRVRSANGVPIVIEENHVAPELADMQNENLAGSFYDILMNKYHMIPANKGRRSVKIIFADADTAEHLEVSQGTPIIESEMCVFDVNGEPIHTVKDLVRGDNDRFMKWYV